MLLLMRTKQLAYEEFLKEKLVIDEIVQRIYEEDRQVAQAQMEKQVRYQPRVAALPASVSCRLPIPAATAIIRSLHPSFGRLLIF